MRRKPYKRAQQIAVYAPDWMIKQLREDAQERRRKLGPTVLEIVREYLEMKGKGGPKFADT